MIMRIFTRIMAWCATLMVLHVLPAQAGDIVVIGHSNVPKMDVLTVQKIYTGKFIAVAGVSVVPVGMTSGSPVRSRFLQEFLGQDEEKYDAYWTVRRYIGKGTPPSEMADAADVIRYVLSTPGGIGYIDAVELRTGLNVLARK
jgi:ABC-type phosphate transport system substrate-binding protein